MTKQSSKKLSSRTVDAAKPGKYADGNNLYLRVSPSGARKWVLRFNWRGKAREMGLGRASGETLKEARLKAQDAYRLISEGVDPILARKRQGGVPTFKAMAFEVITALSPGFRNDKHREQWSSSLARYAGLISDLPVDEIDTECVLQVLRPIWVTKAETASRVRGRIEKILDAAKAKGFRNGENPARWRGHLDHLLPRQSKLNRGHHEAMPYQDVPGFISKLRKREAIAAYALEFCILTATRSGEVLGARWDEIDLNARIWTIPANRMKAGREHQVPLADRAIEILKTALDVRSSDFVFPGQKESRPLSPMAMEMVLRRMEIKNATVHGFRSSFRDWAGDYTSFAREIAEEALSHVIGDKAERAYRRGNALEKRRQLMQAWEKFINNESRDNVTDFRGAVRHVTI